jgi:hypothetical protein
MNHEIWSYSDQDVFLRGAKLVICLPSVRCSFMKRYPRVCVPPKIIIKPVIPSLTSSSSEVVGPALLLGPQRGVVASGVGLELHLVGIDNLAAAVLALYWVGRSAMRNDAMQCKSIR